MNPGPHAAGDCDGAVAPDEGGVAPEPLTDLTSQVDRAGSIARSPLTPLHVVAAIAVACGFDGPVDDQARSVVVPTLEGFDRYSALAGVVARKVVPPGVFEWIAGTTDDDSTRSTRADLAANRWAPAEVLTLLATDPEVRTRDLLARNLAAPPSALARAARIGPTWVCQRAAAHRNADATVFAVILEHGDVLSRWEVAARADLDDATRERAVVDRHELVRGAALGEHGGPGSPPEPYIRYKSCFAAGLVVDRAPSCFADTWDGVVAEMVALVRAHHLTSPDPDDWDMWDRTSVLFDTMTDEAALRWIESNP